MSGRESQLLTTLSPDQIFKKLAEERKDLQLLPALRTAYIAHIQEHADDLPAGWLEEQLEEHDAACFMEAVLHVLGVMVDPLASDKGEFIYSEASSLAEEIQALLADTYGFQRCTFHFRAKAPALDL